MGDGSRQGASIDRQLDIVLTFQRIPDLPTTRKVDSVDKVEDDAIRICHFGNNSRELVCGGQCCLALLAMGSPHGTIRFGHRYFGREPIATQECLQHARANN